MRKKAVFFLIFPSNPGTLAEGWGYTVTRASFYVAAENLSLLAPSSGPQSWKRREKQ